MHRQSICERRIRVSGGWTIEAFERGEDNSNSQLESGLLSVINSDNLLDHAVRLLEPTTITKKFEDLKLSSEGESPSL